jgi:hypothetical protein
MTRGRLLAALVASLVVVGGIGGTTWLLRASNNHKPGPAAAAVSPTPATAGGTGISSVVYVHYYLWWTKQHWSDKLGNAYPYGAAPIPGSTDSNGCNPTVGYSGATIVDVPAEGLYDQTQPSTFENHIALAQGAGIKGFLADWQGTGATAQRTSSSGYNGRLDLLVRTVDAYNSTHGTGFGLGLAYASFGDYSRPASELIADLRYFVAQYGADPAFKNLYSPKPIVMWLDSRKFSAQTIRQVSAAVQPYVFLLGDETASSWPSDGQYLDGTSYYWSTQDPWDNARAGSAVQQLATEVRADGKRWFAPFIAGYDKQLMGGTCVQRRGTDTLATLWRLNGATRPDAWFGISWNEFVENTYLEPTKRYGRTYLDALAALIKGGSAPAA